MISSRHLCTHHPRSNSGLLSPSPSLISPLSPPPWPSISPSTRAVRKLLRGNVPDLILATQDPLLPVSLLPNLSTPHFALPHAHAHVHNRTARHPTASTTKVPTIDPTHVNSVSVLMLHPNGTARSSHRSFCPSGQTSVERTGARIGKDERFGTQVDDYIASLTMTGVSIYSFTGVALRVRGDRCLGKGDG